MLNLMRGSFKTRSRVELWAHAAALILAAAVTAIAVARMFITNSQRKAAAAASGVAGNGGRRSMSGQIALSMGAKSLFFIAYQLAAEHTRFFTVRPKVNMILNCIEAVAWPVVSVFGVLGILKKCNGTTCILTGIIVALAGILSKVSVLAALISIGDWQYFKKTGVRPSDVEEPSEVEEAREVRDAREVKMKSATVEARDSHLFKESRLEVRG